MSRATETKRTRIFLGKRGGIHVEAQERKIVGQCVCGKTIRAAAGQVVKIIRTGKCKHQKRYGH